jgi:hypothetical protein
MELRTLEAVAALLACQMEQPWLALAALVL